MKILIVNSRGHWINGWMSFPESLDIVLNVLNKTGYEVKSVEVTSFKELDDVLKQTNPDTLVWANAYWVTGKNGKLHGLLKEIQKYNLPMIGSNSETLSILLEKDTCQKILKEGNIPTPDYLIIDESNKDKASDLINNITFSFPLIIKPTKESRSQGVTKVNNRQEAIDTIETLSHRFPNSNIIVEEFLPNNDVTCGFLKLGHEIMLLPSYIVVEGLDYSTDIISEAHYALPLFSYEQQVITDDIVLSQLRKHIPNVVSLLGINNVTRIDGRLDKNGKLKFFDVNGMPGLSYPISGLIKQCFSHFPTYSEDYIFECLLNTIVIENFEQHDIFVPLSIRKHQLFNLKSDTTIKLKIDVKKEVNSLVG